MPQKNKSNCILHERLGLTENDRLLLKTLDELSPIDSTHVMLGTNDIEFPTIDILSEVLGLSTRDAIAIINHICAVWSIPKAVDLPTGNGHLSTLEAQLRAVLNQHRLRFDPEIQDYRIPRIHFYTSELGTGQLYTNNKAFEGERIFREAVGYDNIMNSYHIQGGVMPEMIEMFGKSKNQRAILTGLNKTGTTADASAIEHLALIVKAIQEKDVSEKQSAHIKESFTLTLDSMEEAAKSVAHEVAPLLKNIPEYVPIHIYYSYNDDANLNEIEDQLLTKMRAVYKKMATASESLPALRDELVMANLDKGLYDINLKVAEYIRASYENVAKGNKSFQDLLKTFLLDAKGNYTPELIKALCDTKEEYIKRSNNSEAYDNELQYVIFTYCTETNTLDTIRHNMDKWRRRRQQLLTRITSLENSIAENEQFETAYETEQRSGHSWFTKAIAIKPTEAKANEMVKKELYKDLYTNVMLPEICAINGKKHNIFIHTDREITVYVPDPTYLIGKNTYPNNKLYGTIINSVPRVNRQRSNEPMLESTYELQKKHESAIATRLKLQKVRPQTVEEFNKRESCFADVVWTSHGSDGFRLQPKIVVAPTMVDSEYEDSPEIVYYLKTPTRHNIREISAQMKKGNRGAWASKRLEKGGPTTGNVMQIQHADGSNEWFFFDDAFYESIVDNYGEEIKKVEAKISATKAQKSLKKLYNEKVALLEKVKVESNYIVLMNDVHLGSYTMPGRPSNIDVIKSSTEAAVQALGFDKIVGMQNSEILHGSLRFGSYDSAYEGLDANPVKMLTQSSSLLAQANDENALDILKQFATLIQENEYARAVFKARDQKEMFAKLLKPLMLEMMNKGIVVFLGAGNHWNSSNKTEDEVSTLASMFESHYTEDNLLQYRHAGGQSYSIDIMKLPANVPINAMISHKMQHGKTEIGAMMSQASGTKQDAIFVITADRHHSGMVAEKERFGLLDTGKQAPMPYVTAIGKAPSNRGIIAMGYSPNRDLYYSARFWLDDVVHKLIGWKQRVEQLKQIHNILKKK